MNRLYYWNLFSINIKSSLKMISIRDTLLIYINTLLLFEDISYIIYSMIKRKWRHF